MKTWAQEPITETPEAFAGMLQKEIAKLAPVVKTSGAKIE